MVSEVPRTTLRRFLKKIQGNDEVLYQNCFTWKGENIMTCTSLLGGVDEVVSEVKRTTIRRFLKKIQVKDEVIYQDYFTEKR